MKCVTNKPGKECGFMSRNGCTFIDGACKPVIDMCSKCKKIETFNNVEYCMAYADPWAKHNTGTCSLATTRVLKVEEVKKLNPLKASKRKKKS